MKCKRVRSRLSAFQDRELPVPQARQIARHLESCPACRAESETLNELVGRLCRLTLPAAAPEFSSRIMAGLRTRPEKKYRLLPSLAYTLAGLTVFISGFLLEISANGKPAAAAQPPATFSAVLEESRDLGLLAVQDSTLDFFSGDEHEKQ